ncbi:MAG TPA: hypothetical protein VLD37_02540 [Candidatus Bilamarchaeum sp.]|nr:hypothetical protein [Candidatus Bilamarchaeum sp.]
MSRLKSPDAFPPGRRAVAFIRGLPDFEPLLNVAREGLSIEGVPEERRCAFAMKIAESRSSSCGEIARLIKTLSSPQSSMPVSADPYRSTVPPSEIPPPVQDRLCELYLARYREAMEALLSEETNAGSPENASHIINARMRSRLDKAASAYGLLKGGAITSPLARRHLASVFCDAAQDVLSGGMIFNVDAEEIREGVIRESGVPEMRNIISDGVSAHEAGRILGAVSVALCGPEK